MGTKCTWRWMRFRVLMQTKEKTSQKQCSTAFSTSFVNYRMSTAFWMSILAPFWLFTWLSSEVGLDLPTITELQFPNLGVFIVRWENCKTGTTAGVKGFCVLCGVIVVANTNHLVVMTFPGCCPQSSVRRNRIGPGWANSIEWVRLKMGKLKNEPGIQISPKCIVLFQVWKFSWTPWLSCFVHIHSLVFAYIPHLSVSSFPFFFFGLGLILYFNTPFVVSQTCAT